MNVNIWCLLGCFSFLSLTCTIDPCCRGDSSCSHFYMVSPSEHMLDLSTQSILCPVAKMLLWILCMCLLCEVCTHSSEVETTRLFSRMDVPIPTPEGGVWEPRWLTASPRLGIVCPFYFNCSAGNAVMSHCEFNLQPSNDQKSSTFSCLLVTYRSFAKGQFKPFAHLLLMWLPFSHGFVGSLRILDRSPWIVHVLQISFNILACLLALLLCFLINRSY